VPAVVGIRLSLVRGRTFILSQRGPGRGVALHEASERVLRDPGATATTVPATPAPGIGTRLAALAPRSYSPPRIRALRPVLVRRAERRVDRANDDRRLRRRGSAGSRAAHHRCPCVPLGVTRNHDGRPQNDTRCSSRPNGTCSRRGGWHHETPIGGTCGRGPPLETPGRRGRCSPPQGHRAVPAEPAPQDARQRLFNLAGFGTASVMGATRQAGPESFGPVPPKGVVARSRM
jgi:hypothetical protein